MPGAEASSTAAAFIRATPTEIAIHVPGSLSRGARLAVYELSPADNDDAWRQRKALCLYVVDSSGRVVITLPRYDGSGSGRRDRLYSKFVVTRAGDKNAQPLLPAHFIDDISAVAYHRFDFPRAKSKKGLQVSMIDDALKLGIKHAAMNVNLPYLFAWGDTTGALIYRMDGKPFYFRADAVNRLDSRIKTLSDAGVIISLVILNREMGDTNARRIMLHPRYNPACPNHYSAFNTVTEEGRRYFQAVMEFLADRYTRPDKKYGWALNYIIGNEVTAHWWWTNMGEVTMEGFADDYLRTVRIADTACRKVCSAARVYVSLEHNWTIFYGDNPLRAFAGKHFIDRFARRARWQGDFPWNLAFHAYPEALWNAATWNDKEAVDSFSSPKITFRNIAMLPAYFSRPELLYHNHIRHIILSEQGFHAGDDAKSELVQAAAFCYAYYKVSHLDGIDSYIYYRHRDHPGEAGLKFGLWAPQVVNGKQSWRQRKIYHVFKLADTPHWRQAFAFAKPIIGIKNWTELLPGNMPACHD